MVILQVPSIILPIVHPLGNEVEWLNDLVVHRSIEFEISFIRDKNIQIMATEILPFGGVPGALWAWVELSPVPSTISALYWAAIGGGGGVRPPLAPVIEAPTGVPDTAHTFMLPWNIHSAWARLVCQVPVAATPLMTFWAVQAVISGKTP